MEHYVRVTEDPDWQVRPATDVILTYDSDNKWTAYSLEIAGEMVFEYLYLADNLAGAIIGANSLAASTGPTGALLLIEEPAP